MMPNAQPMPQGGLIDQGAQPPAAAPPAPPAVPPSKPKMGIGDAIQKIVLAGKKIIYDKKGFALVKRRLLGNEPLPKKLALEAGGVIYLMDRRQNMALPKRAIVPAATALLFELVDFVREAKIADPTEDEIKQAITLMIKLLMDRYGVSDELAKKQKARPMQQARPPQGQPGMPPPPPAQQPAGLIGA